MGPAAAVPAVVPDASWDRIGDPRSAGYCHPGFDSVSGRAKEFGTTGMAVAGGRVLYEYGDVEVVSYLASVRKSVLAMLYGTYVESGQIRLDRTLELVHGIVNARCP